MEERIKSIFESWRKTSGFSGVFSAAKGQAPVCQAAFGYRNRAEKLKNLPGTRFGIASGTKLFTALAVCGLIAEGRLRLEDEIGLFLPGLGTIHPEITVYQLLTHTSGVGDYIDENSPDMMRDLAALYNTYPVQLWENLSYYLQMSNRLPPKFPPGQQFAYSNTGYVLLGLIAEAVTGQSCQAFIEQSILAPAGMKDSGFFRSDALPANTANGYFFDEERAIWRTNIFCLPVRGGSDGGLYTTAADLNRLWRALFAGRVLPAPMLEKFLAPQVGRGENRGYGLGVYLFGTGENTVYYAVGGDFGVDFFTLYAPKHALSVSALGNLEADMGDLLCRLLPLLAGL